MFFLLPYSIGRKAEKIPFITYGLIFLNTLVFIATYFTDFSRVLALWAFRPGPGAWYTWLTSSFLHASIFHLVGNMLFLYVFGSFLEEALGWIKFITVYILGAFVSAMLFGFINLTFMASTAFIPLIGASGAISALLGVSMLRFRHNDLYIYYFTFIFYFVRWGTFTVKTYVAVLVYFFMELFSGMAQIATAVPGGVGHWAHIGGFICGLAAVPFLHISQEAAREVQEDKAASWLKSGSAAIAAAKFEELKGEQPKKADYFRGAGLAYLKQDDLQAAVENYSQAIELYLRHRQEDEAVKAYQEVFNYRPDVCLRPRAQFAVCALMQKQGEFINAVRGFKRLLTDYPEGTQAELAQLRLGQLYNKMGDIAAAQDAFKQFLEKYPHSEWKVWVEKWLATEAGAGGYENLSRTA